MSSSTAKGETSARRKRATSSSAAPAASASPTEEARKDGMLVCPECGKTFKSPAGLGAHRSAAHGVAGSSRRARSNVASKTAGKTGSAKTASASAGTPSASSAAPRRRVGRPLREPGAARRRRTDASSTAISSSRCSSRRESRQGSV